MNSEVRSIVLELQRQSEDESFVFRSRNTGVNLTDVTHGSTELARMQASMTSDFTI